MAGNSLWGSFKKVYTLRRPHTDGQSEGQQSDGSSASLSPTISTTQFSLYGTLSTTSTPTQVISSVSVAQAQPETQHSPPNKDAASTSDSAALPVVPTPITPLAGSPVLSGNQDSILPRNINNVSNLPSPTVRASMHHNDTYLSGGSPSPALREAIEQFAAELSDDDRKAFVEAKDIMLEIQRPNEDHARNSISRSLGTRVERVLLCMRNFVASVSICIQHRPDISSLVVGGFNCVLMLALGYIEFFGKLTAMMDRIAGHLVYLTKYGSPIFQNSPDVQNTLKDAYCDLLDFLVAVRKVFTERKVSRSSYLSSVSLFVRIHWESFEYKFQPIEERFSHHALVIVRVAGVEAMINNVEGSRAKQREERNNKRREVLKWLSNLEYEKAQQTYFQKHLAGTGQWLLEHPEFLSWQNSRESGILWCHGGPGAGKTVLASLVIDRMSTMCQSTDDMALSFLYCNYKEAVEPETYVRTAIKQLSRQLKVLPYELEALYDKHFNDDTVPSMAELQDVFISLSNSFRQIVLVIDALDECTSDSRQGLCRFLQHVCSTGISHRTVKVFVTSRREEDIRRALSSFPIVEIEAIKVNEDIRSYVEVQLEKYRQDGRLRLSDPALNTTIVSILVDCAGGMFLWVDFQLQHICSQTSDYHIQAALKDLPEGMDDTYQRIISLIRTKPKAEQDLARRVLMWIAYATQPLDIYDLRSLVALEKTTGSESECYRIYTRELTKE